MLPTDKIWEIGFMGCGKSTVGPVLARRLCWDFIGIDEEIEREQGMSITDMVAQKGMPYFRELEAAKIKQLPSERNMVIAAGGGAFISKANRMVMLSSGFVVWLYVPIEAIMERLLSKPEEIAKRPLLQGPKRTVRRKIMQLYKERELLYRGAHEIIPADGTKEEIAEHIIRMHEAFGKALQP